MFSIFTVVFFFENWGVLSIPFVSFLEFHGSWECLKTHSFCKDVVQEFVHAFSGEAALHNAELFLLWLNQNDCWETKAKAKLSFEIKLVTS